MQDSSYQAFPIIISPSAWYYRQWSPGVYVFQPFLNRGNGTFSIHNTWSDQPSSAQFDNDYDKPVLPNIDDSLSKDECLNYGFAERKTIV